MILTGQPPYTHTRQALAGDVTEAFARLDGCGADAELIALAKACLLPDPGARLSDAVEVAGRVKRYQDDVVSRQAEVERPLWICAAAEVFPRPPRTPVRGYGNRSGRCSAPKWRCRRERLSSASPAEAAAARQVLECLRGLPVLAGVHDPAAPTDLPEPERQEWQAFWQEVEGLLRGPDPAR